MEENFALFLFFPTEKYEVFIFNSSNRQSHFLLTVFTMIFSFSHVFVVLLSLIYMVSILYCTHVGWLVVRPRRGYSPPVPSSSKRNHDIQQVPTRVILQPCTSIFAQKSNPGSSQCLRFESDQIGTGNQLTIKI
jgi:hypothetical protein